MLEATAKLKTKAEPSYNIVKGEILTVEYLPDEAYKLIRHFFTAISNHA